MQKLALQANPRKGKARAVIRQGFIPAVIYGHELKAVSVQVESGVFKKIWQKAGSTSLISLEDGKTEHQVIIREIQHHPVQGHVTHIDFYKVKMDEAIKAKVPLSFTGTAPAVKDLNGIFVRNLDELELEALPKDLPHEITVDISILTDFEKVIHVKDITVPKGITVLVDEEAVVALVQPPRSEEELEKLSEEVKEDIEAVEGVVKPEKPAEGEEGAEAPAPDTKVDKKAEKKE